MYRRYVRGAIIAACSLAATFVALPSRSALAAETPSTDCALGRGAPPQRLLEASVLGREIVRAAAARLGGIENLHNIKRLRHVTEGTVADGLQSPDPAKVDDPAVTGTFTRTWTLDLEKKRHRRDTSLTQADGRFDSSDYYADGKLVTVYPVNHISWTRDSTEAGFVDGIERYDPALVVLRALDAIATVTWVGGSCDTGASADVIEFSWNARSRMRLHIARADQRLRRVEVFLGDPLRGDDSAFYDFEGELIAAGVAFPKTIVLRRRGGVFTISRTTELEVNPVFDAAVFTVPAGQSPLPDPYPARAIGDGLYEVGQTDNGEWYAQFMDLGDGVAVFDATLSEEDATDVLRQIKRTLGDKPVKYVILSHAHDDHVAGIGAYVALGAKVISTRENAALVTRYANVSSRLDAGPARSRRTPDFIFVNAKPLDVQGTNGRSVTVYRLNDLDHVRPMLVAYYPPARTLLDADIYSDTAPLSTDARRLATWLRTAGAPPAEWIAGTHHRMLSAQNTQAAHS